MKDLAENDNEIFRAWKGGGGGLLRRRWERYDIFIIGREMMGC